MEGTAGRRPGHKLAFINPITAQARPVRAARREGSPGFRRHSRWPGCQTRVPAPLRIPAALLPRPHAERLSSTASRPHSLYLGFGESYRFINLILILLKRKTPKPAEGKRKPSGLVLKVQTKGAVQVSQLQLLVRLKKLKRKEIKLTL